MNPKIQKTISEIERTRQKISELQARLRELEVQRTDLENTEIVSLFRSIDVAPHELADFIREYKVQPLSSPAAQSVPYTPAYQAEQEVSDNEED